jgi:hypothetical protein
MPRPIFLLRRSCRLAWGLIFLLVTIACDQVLDLHGDFSAQRCSSSFQHQFPVHFRVLVILLAVRVASFLRGDLPATKDFVCGGVVMSAEHHCSVLVLQFDYRPTLMINYQISSFCFPNCVRVLAGSAGVVLELSKKNA